MEITSEQLIQLNRIYNTLSLIYTNGKNTIMMATCLQALESLVQDISNPQIKEETQTIAIPIDQISKQEKMIGDSSISSSIY